MGEVKGVYATRPPFTGLFGLRSNIWRWPVMEGVFCKEISNADGFNAAENQIKKNNLTLIYSISPYFNGNIDIVAFRQREH